MELIALIAAIFFCEIVGTIAGFGAPTLLFPIALFLVDFPSAIVIVTVTNIAGNATLCGLYRHSIDKDVLFRFGVPSVLGGIIGAMLVSVIPSELVKIVLGVVLMIYAFSSWHTPHFEILPTEQNFIIGGLSSGFFAGLIATGGALRGAFLHAFGLRKNVFVATIASVALLVDVTRLPVYLSNGFLDPSFYPFILPFIGVAALGAFLGRSIAHTMPAHTFKNYVLGAVFLIGLWFAVGSFL